MTCIILAVHKLHLYLLASPGPKIHTGSSLLSVLMNINDAFGAFGFRGWEKQDNDIAHTHSIEFAMTVVIV